MDKSQLSIGEARSILANLFRHEYGGEGTWDVYWTRNEDGSHGHDVAIAFDNRVYYGCGGPSYSVIFGETEDRARTTFKGEDALSLRELGNTPPS